MTWPAIKITFDGDVRGYRPGETLAGEYRLEAIQPSEVRAIELSVLWYTEGKGDEDLAVHFFERREPAGGDYVDLAHPCRFATRLPNCPLTYSGMIVKIRWCVRVRVFFARGKEMNAEEPFQLGPAPPVEAVSP
jgi:hypothetical protein